MQIVPGFIQRAAAGRLLRNGKDTPDIERKLPLWKDLHSIACLIDDSDTNALRLLLNRLHAYSSNDLTIHIYGYCKSMPPFEDYGITWFNKKKLNWMGVPDATVVKSMNIYPHDLLINAGNQNCLPLHYLSALSTAGMRMAPYQEEYLAFYDCTFGSVKNANDLLDQVEHYLHYPLKKQHELR